MATRSQLKATDCEPQARSNPQDLRHGGASQRSPDPPHHRGPRARADQAAGLPRPRARTRQEPRRRPGHQGSPGRPAGRPLTWRGGRSGADHRPRAGRGGGPPSPGRTPARRGEPVGRLAGARRRPERAGTPARLGPGTQTIPHDRPLAAPPSPPTRRRACPSLGGRRPAAVPGSPPGGLQP